MIISFFYIHDQLPKHAIFVNFKIFADIDWKRYIYIYGEAYFKQSTLQRANE